MRTLRKATLPLLAGVLVACSSPAGTDAAGSATSGGTTLPAVDLAQVALPLPLEFGAVLDPAWTRVPQELDGVFVGFTGTTGSLTFTATAADGTRLWETDRPPSCTGFVLTRSGDRALAVLTDQQTHEGGFRIVATALDLTTGEPVWGPVQVPGPHRGPGPVFSAGPSGLGPHGPRTLLDPADGTEITVPAGHELSPETTVLGIVGDVVLLTDGQGLVGWTKAHQQVRWQLGAQELSGADPREIAGQPIGDIRVLLGTGEDRALVDVDTGTVLATGIAGAVAEELTGTLVTLGPAGLSGVGVDGSRAWLVPLDPGHELVGAVGAAVLVRSGGSLSVRNVVTGDLIAFYAAEDLAAGRVPALPVLAGPDGSTVLGLPSGWMLATGA